MFRVLGAASVYLLACVGVMVGLHAVHARPWTVVLALWLSGAVAGFLGRGMVLRRG